MSTPSQSEVILAHSSSRDAQLKKTPLSQITRNGQEAQSAEALVSTSRTPITKQGTSASPSRVVNGQSSKYLQSTSPGRGASATVTQKSTGGTARTPATKAGTPASPGRLVSSSASKRVQPFSPGRGPSAPVTQKSSGGTSRTPVTKMGTSTSPARVVGGSAVKRRQSASPGRGITTPKAQRGVASETTATKPSTSASPGRHPAASPGRVVNATAAQRSRTPTTKPSMSASPGRLPDNSAAKRHQSASPARVPSTLVSTGRTSRTPATKSGVSASPRPAMTGSAARLQKSAGPKHVPSMPGTTTGGKSQTPKTKPTTPASPGRVVSGSAAKRQKPVSPGRIPNAAGGASQTPKIKPTTSVTSKTPATKAGTSASPGHVASVSSARQQKSPSQKRAASSPSIETSTAVETQTPKTKHATSSRVISDSASRRQKSMSPGHVFDTAGNVTSTDGESQTPMTRPSPGHVVHGSAARRKKSATPRRAASTPGPETSTDVVSQTPKTKATTSASPGRAASGSAAKRKKSATPRRAASTPGPETSTDVVSQTPKTKATTAASPGRAASGSAAKRQKSASPRRAASTPGPETSTDVVSQTPKTKATTSASPGRAANGSAAKRKKSATPRHAASTPGPETSTDVVSQTPKTKATTAASPGRAASGSAAKRQKSVSPRRPASTPGPKTSTDVVSQTPKTKATTAASPGRAASGSAAKRQKSASPGRVRSSLETETSADVVSQTAKMKQTSSGSPGRVVSGSASKRQKSTSPGHVASSAAARRRNSASAEQDADTGVTPASTVDTHVSAYHQAKGSATKRRKSASAGRTEASDTGTGNTPARPSPQPSGSLAKRRHSASPTRAAATPVIQKSGDTSKSDMQSAASSLLSSHKLSTKRGVKRSGGPLEEPPRKQLGVSFGPDMSPELFDQRLPPITPVKRGATPQRISAAGSLRKPLLKGRHSAVGTVVMEDTAVSFDSAKTSKSANRRSKSTDHIRFTLESNVNATSTSAVEPVLKGRRSVPEMSIVVEANYAAVAVDSTQAPKASKRRSKSAERSLAVLEASVKEMLPSALEVVLKGRHSAGTSVAEVSPKTPKAAKRRSQSAEHSDKKLEKDIKKNDAKTGKKRSRSLSAVDDQELDAQDVSTIDKASKRSRSMIGSKEAIAGGDNLESQTSKKSPVALGLHRQTAASPGRVKRTPEKPFQYKSPTLETGSIKVKGSKKVVAPSPKRARSLSSSASPARVVGGPAAKQQNSASPGRVRGTPSTETTTDVVSQSLKTKPAASGSSGLVASGSAAKRQSVSPGRILTTPAAETSTHVASQTPKSQPTTPRAQGHVASGSAAKRRKSTEDKTSPEKFLAKARNQPAPASPDRFKRTPQKPFRYRSPTLETGSIKLKGSKKIAEPPAKRARSLSREIPVVSAQVTKTVDLTVGMKGKPTLVEVESSPASSRRDKSPQIMHSSPAIASKTLSGSKPVSAKKRMSLTGSEQKEKKFSDINSDKLSSGKKVNLPYLDLGEISVSPASGKKLKASGGGKNLTSDAVQKSTETATSARAITPSRMVAMRAVFGREMTPKLKMPYDVSPSNIAQSTTATSARKRDTVAVKPSSGQKSAAKHSAVKVASLKKSARKSTAKKTLWSEVVRRTATTQKSGPKIVKPVIRPPQKIKAAVMAVVSVIFCCY